jgi:hypothetical protein
MVFAQTKVRETRKADIRCPEREWSHWAGSNGILCSGILRYERPSGLNCRFEVGPVFALDP